MKLYKDNQNNIFAYEEDGSQDHLIGDKTLITKLEADAITESKIDKIAVCKEQAKVLLSQTDWAVLPDVGLANQDAFVFYRLNLRNLVINPVADAVFEAIPEPIWS